MAATGEEALAEVARIHPDLVVLDLGLPGIDGIEVIEGIRGWSPVPILVLSARGAEDAKVAALDAGADDYVTKPFGMAELLARVRAEHPAAAATAADGTAVVETTDFTVDLAAKRVPARRRGGPPHADRVARRRGARAQRRPAGHPEAAAAGGVGSRLRERDELPPALPGPASAASSNPSPSRPRYFITEPGMGYRFES